MSEICSIMQRKFFDNLKGEIFDGGWMGVGVGVEDNLSKRTQAEEIHVWFCWLVTQEANKHCLS
jgi:hypothetical protein